MKNLLFLLLFPILLSAQKTTELKVDAMSTGTLYTPEKPANNYIVILVAGSGPTDRDGNQPELENNSLKFLAQELSKSGTAVFAYDKQTVVLSRSGAAEQESNFKFDSMIFDLSEIVSYFRAEQPYKKIII
ncbi:MAG: alpha/beta hydrolase, partial [Chitinophagaceae bacterium]